jgi:hypothetical protein
MGGLPIFTYSNGASLVQASGGTDEQTSTIGTGGTRREENWMVKTHKNLIKAAALLFTERTHNSSLCDWMAVAFDPISSHRPTFVACASNEKGLAKAKPFVEHVRRED